MKRNLKEEIEKIFDDNYNDPGYIPEEVCFDFKTAHKQFLTLFSKTLDHVIGEDDRIVPNTTDFTVDLNNKLRKQQRARKKSILNIDEGLVLSNKEGELLK